MKWRKRVTVNDRPMGPRELRSTVFLIEEEALWAAFRKHTLRPLDDCLYTLQASLPHLARPSLHRLFQRHDILSAHLAAFVDANRTTCGAVGEKMRDITQRGGISKAQAGPHPG